MLKSTRKITNSKTGGDRIAPDHARIRRHGREQYAKHHGSTIANWWRNILIKINRVKNRNFWTCGWISWRRQRVSYRMKVYFNEYWSWRMSCSRLRKNWKRRTRICLGVIRVAPVKWWVPQVHPFTVPHPDTKRTKTHPFITAPQFINPRD